MLKRLLESLYGIERVTVHYSTPVDHVEARRMCTSQGNDVTITFEDATAYPHTDGVAGAPLQGTRTVTTGGPFDGNVTMDDCLDMGDLPEIEFDPLNAPQNPRNGLAEGDGTFLHMQYRCVLKVSRNGLRAPRKHRRVGAKHVRT